MYQNILNLKQPNLLIETYISLFHKNFEVEHKNVPHSKAILYFVIFLVSQLQTVHDSWYTTLMYVIFIRHTPINVNKNLILHYQIMWYYYDDVPKTIWTCYSTGCDCVGDYCSWTTLNIFGEEVGDQAGCIYGHTVRFEFSISDSRVAFSELAITAIGKISSRTIGNFSLIS